MSKQKSLYIYPAKGVQMPFTATAQTAPTNLFSTDSWQIGGVYSGTIPLTFTAWTGTQAQTFSTSLGFSSFTLPQGASANVNASVSIANQSFGIYPIFSTPYLYLTVQGSATQTGVGGGVSQFTLKAGRTYSGFTLGGTIVAYSALAQLQQVVYITVQALLLGLPAST